ncbi:accessory gene regulator B family protein [Clostridium sp. WILCCON 0269]|uniref:Accessory gene regulator B family protein n=1 Tax=Candidatus Clostridium eludens TaxID=3381663 RepID=A0ABW8SRR9_9CLOT
MCIFAPVDNVNKRIKSNERRMKLRYTSIIITFLSSVASYFIPHGFLIFLFCSTTRVSSL